MIFFYVKAMFFVVFFCALSEAANLHWPLIDTLIRTGNCAQANMILQEIHEESPMVNVYKGTSLWCSQEYESAISFLQKSWNLSDKDLRLKAHRWLLLSMKKKDVPQEKILELWEIIRQDLDKNPDWLEVIFAIRLQEGKPEEVCAYQQISTAPLFAVVERACHSLQRQAEFLSRFEFSRLEDNDLRYVYLQSLYQSGDKQKFFSIVESETRDSLWLSRILVYVGQTEKNDSLVERGYRMHFRLNPDFESLRDLSAWLFQSGKNEDSTKLLLDFLQKTNSDSDLILQAARLLLDHNQFSALFEFVEKKRVETKNPLSFAHLLLSAYSTKRDFNAWFKELEKVYPGFPPALVVREIGNFFQQEQYEELINLLFEIQKNQDSVWKIEVLARFSLLYPKPPHWLKQKMNTQTLENRKIVSVSFLNHASQVKAVLFLLSDVQDSEDLQIQMILVQAFSLLGDFYSAWEKFSRFPELKKSMESVFLMTLCSVEELHGLLWEYRNTKLPSFVRPQMERQIAIREGISDPSKNGTVSFSQILSRFYKSENFSENLEQLKSWLHRNPVSSEFTQASFLYQELLDLAKFQKEDFFVLGVNTVLASLCQDANLLNLALRKFESSLDQGGNRDLFSEFLLCYHLKSARLEMFQGQNGKNQDEIISRWEKFVLKLFEEFPDSLYTPISVEQLIQHYSQNGQISKRDELAGKYLMRFPGDLLAQKLRNLLL